MLQLTSRQLQEKLPAWLNARMAVLLVGPPGTGKTFTSRKVAIQTFGEGIVEVLDGGNESDWKGLFPYKTPSGILELGKALRASGYEIKGGQKGGQLEKNYRGGCLIIDEANRVPPELKSPFQLLASERIVPWPEGGTVKLDIAIVSTGNESDLGVEEASRAELDRYDLIIRLSPTPGEMAAIISGEAGVRPQVAEVIYETVANFSRKLDPKKVHLPEGLRVGISIARLLRTGTLGPVDVFRGAAERSWPLGRRGAEKHRAEFDQAVNDAANFFASKLANIGDIAQSGNPQAGSAPMSGASEPATLRELLASLSASTLAQVSTKGTLPLPWPFRAMIHVFTSCFGMGVSKYLIQRMLEEKDGGERHGVWVVFKENSVTFRNADRHRVEKFCRVCENL